MTAFLKVLLLLWMHTDEHYEVRWQFDYLRAYLDDYHTMKRNVEHIELNCPQRHVAHVPFFFPGSRGMT